MKSTLKLFLVLITLIVILIAWITRQLGDPHIRILILILISLTIAVFFIIHVMEHREERRRNARLKTSSERKGTSPTMRNPKRSDTFHALKERKSGLTWGGGNIKASEATRGTRRKFLGK